MSRFLLCIDLDCAPGQVGTESGWRGWRHPGVRSDPPALGVNLERGTQATVFMGKGDRLPPLGGGWGARGSFLSDIG